MFTTRLRNLGKLAQRQLGSFNLPTARAERHYWTVSRRNDAVFVVFATMRPSLMLLASFIPGEADFDSRGRDTYCIDTLDVFETRRCYRGCWRLAPLMSTCRETGHRLPFSGVDLFANLIARSWNDQGALPALLLNKYVPAISWLPHYY